MNGLEEINKDLKEFVKNVRLINFSAARKRKEEFVLSSLLDVGEELQRKAREEIEGRCKIQLNKAP